tara:strand:+ start:5825 stop:6076 length:252 start_codon:yes stop_codon:yes gene_type:complete
MSATRKEIYDLANNFYLNSKIELIESHVTYKVYEIEFKGKKYSVCLCNPRNEYTGSVKKYPYRNKSEKFAKSLCWKKIIEPTL